MMEKDSSLRDVMLRASTIMLLMLVLIKALGYVYHFIFVRLFTQQQYGSFIYIWSMGLFLCGLMIPNVSASMIRYVAYYRGKSDRKSVESTIRTGLVLNIIFTAAAAAALLALFATGVLERAGVRDVDAAAFAFILAVLSINSMSCFFAGVISGYRRPEVASYFSLILQVLRILALLAAAFLASSVLGLMGFTSLFFLLFAVILGVYEYKAYGFGSAFDSGLARPLSSFGFYTIFYTTANNILAWFSLFFIRYYLDAGAVAVYNVAWLGSTLNLLFFTAVLQIFNPVATELFGSKRMDRLIHLTSYVLESFFLLFLPIFLSMMLFAREILVLFFTKDYASGAQPLQILSVGAFFSGIYLLFVELIAAEGRPQVNAKNISVGALVNALLNVVFIPAYGLVGAAYASIISSALILLLSYMHVKTLLRPAFSARRILKIVFASMAAVALVFWAKSLLQSIFDLSSAYASVGLLIACCTLLFGVYLIILVASKSLRSEDVSLVDAGLTKMGFSDKKRRIVLGALKSGVYSATSL
jgi:stage V sporulation protein B